MAPPVNAADSKVSDVDDAPFRVDEEEVEAFVSEKARGGNSPGNAYRDILLVVQGRNEWG